MSTVQVKYSVIIPAYNELESLGELILKCKDILSMRNEVEIILVDNGSTDGSNLYLKKALQKLNIKNFRLVAKELNTGYGAGLKYGFAASQSEFLIWTHADLQCDPLDILRLLDIHHTLPMNNELVIKGDRINRALLDKIFSKSLTFLNRVINRVQLHDVNSQPNLISKKTYFVLEDLPDDSTFELALLTKALKRGCIMYRFPVNFPKRQYGIGSNQGILRKIRFSLISVSTMWKLRT